MSSTTTTQTNDILHDAQNGFRKNRPTIDHIQMLTATIENRKVRKIPIFVLFIDLNKAYDCVLFYETKFHIMEANY